MSIKGKSYYLSKLDDNGWVSLKGCSVILDTTYHNIKKLKYCDEDINVVEVGSMSRVYRDEVMRLLCKQYT